jgi:alpha-1,2-mannosyltransferase
MYHALKSMRASDHIVRPDADPRFVELAFAGSLLSAIFVALYVGFAPPPYNGFGYLLGNDFANTWLSARVSLTGDPTPWFDFDHFNAALKAEFGAQYPVHLWSYPPHLLLFIWPLGFLPVVAAYFVWCMVGLALFVAVAAPARRPIELVLLLVAPAVIVNIYGGQNGHFTAVLMIAGLLSLDRRPVLAGVLFGLLTIKPQLGILIPVLLLMTGRWRTIAAAIITATALVLATALVFGPKIWTAYLDVAWPTQSHIVVHGGGFYMSMMPTTFMNLRSAGLSADTAAAAQAVVSAGALAALVWTFWRRREPVLSAAMFITLTFLATPYAFNYDMVIFAWVTVSLLRRRDNGVWDYGLLLAVWVLPVLIFILGLVGLPCSALVLIAFAARLVWRLRQSGEAGSPLETAGLVPAVPRAMSAP